MKYRIAVIIFAFIIVLFSFIGSCRQNDLLYEIYENTSIHDLSEKGNEFLKNQNPDSALIYYSLVANKYRESMPDSLKVLSADAYVSQGYIYLFYKNDYLSSYTSFLKALDLLENINDSTLYPGIHLNLGNIYLDYKESDKMMEHYKKSFSYSVQEKDWKTLRIVFTTLLSLAISENKPENIKEEIKIFDSLELPETTDFKSLKLQRAALDYLPINYAKAIELLDEAKKESDLGLIQNRYGIICDIQIADILKNARHYDDAIYVVKNVLKENGDEVDIRRTAYSMLSNLYIETNKADSALKYLQLNNALADTMFKSQQYGLIRDIGLNHDLEKLDSRIKTIETEKNATKRALIITSIALFIIISLAIVVFFQNRKLRQRNIELFKRNSEVLKREKKSRELRELYEKQVEDLTKKINNFEIQNKAETIEKTKENEPEEESENKKYKNSHLKEAMQTGLLARIDSVLNNEEEIVKNDFTLDRLSTLVASNTSYVSQIINDVYGKNFQTLLGESRIKRACDRLCDKKYDHLTIEGIALELGFKSRTNFISVFKKVTGLTPSQYRKLN